MIRLRKLPADNQNAHNQPSIAREQDWHGDMAVAQIKERTPWG